MFNDKNMEIQIIIENYDKINKYITFKPYCNILKKPIEYYESYNFDLKNYNPEEDILKVLGKISKPILQKLIDFENSENSENIETLEIFIEDNLNKILKINTIELEEIANPVEFTTNEYPVTGSKLTFIL
jgi:hypothetical protein